MKILFIGDIVGKPGRKITQKAIPLLIKYYAVDFTIANVENAAGGLGVTQEVAESIRDAGVHIMTSGNHIWDKKEALSYIELEPRLLRPANYPPEVPGKGRYVAKISGNNMVAVINIMGRIFMNPLDNPFHVVRKEIAAVLKETRVIIVDFHAEATSEKRAMGWHLDGQVTAVVGTHTHVQTADEQVLPSGTAYITDVGMTGPHDSIIGVQIRPVLTRFLNGMPSRFETATEHPRINAVIITADQETGKASSIERINLSDQDLELLEDRME